MNMLPPNAQLPWRAVLAACRGATCDSRRVAPGMLYVALKGARVDGHDFVSAALAAGAARALVQAEWSAPQGVDEARLVRVADVRRAFGDLARAYRATLPAVVVGVTGSAGKTTVKELTAALLRAGGYRVHATSGNFNNDLGLPLTVLNCPPEVDFLVLEMGSNHPGEIAYLAGIAAPNVGIISSIGTAHIEFFKTQEGIADEKGALLAALVPHRDGKPSFAVVARETVCAARLCAASARPVVMVAPDSEEEASVAQALASRLPGSHNVLNARLACACARAFGVPEAACVAALAQVVLPGGRWRTVVRDGVTYIDDTYNANPTAMIAALETFAAQPCAGRRWAVLGDMFELGAQTARFHSEVLARARALGLDEIVLVGAHFRAAAENAPVPCVADAAAARAYVAERVRPGDSVLVKASHSMDLGRVIDA